MEVNFLLKLEQPEITTFEDAVDALNFREKQDELYEKYLFPGKNNDTKNENIVELLNNHSILVKSKESDKKVIGRMKNWQEDEMGDDPDSLIRSLSKMSIEKAEDIRAAVKQKQIDLEESFKSKFDDKKRHDLQSHWEDFINERKKRIDRRILINVRTY